MQEKPLFSIVIVNFNYGGFLEEAIASILGQSCQDFELIIVDGGSTDNSVEIIQAFSDRLGGVRFNETGVASSEKIKCGCSNVLEHGTKSERRFDSGTSELQNSRTRFLWCSEPDKGQSEAFNKGFSHASGRFLTWVNADDVLMPGALELAKKAIVQNPECEWFAGGSFWLDPKMQVIKCVQARAFSRIRAKRGAISVWAPSSFFSKVLLDRVGGVDNDFHYMMDTELWFRFHRQTGAVYRTVSGYCWGLRLHPDAKMSGHNFAGSLHSQETHPKWSQMRKEKEIFNSRYGLSRVTLMTRWGTTSPWIFLKNTFDLWRFKGKFYRDCFGGQS